MKEEKPVKKVKEEKPIDYSRVPPHIWEKHWAQFIEEMNQIEVGLRNVEALLDVITK